MNERRSCAPEEVPESVVLPLVPDRQCSQQEGVHAGRLAVVDRVSGDGMPVLLQEIRLQPEDTVFAARLLVMIVNDSDVHPATIGVTAPDTSGAEASIWIELVDGKGALTYKLTIGPAQRVQRPRTLALQSWLG